MNYTKYIVKNGTNVSNTECLIEYVIETISIVGIINIHNLINALSNINIMS